MIKQLQRQTEVKNQPIYSVIWDFFKNFPGGLSAGSKNAPIASGTAAAAMISAAIGCFTMMVTHHLSDTSKAREKIIWQIGSWIPGSHNPSPLWGNIGSYSGKETMLLISWLCSWAILHFLWRKKNIRTSTMFFWFSILLITATAMAWHPLFPYLPLL